MGAIVVLHVLSSSISTDFLNYEVVRAVILVVNMMISLSYPLNFGIYCGMSKQFRDTFTELFIKRVTRRNSMQMVSVCLKLADIDDMTWKNVYQWYAKWILLAQSVSHRRHDGRCFTQCKHLNLLARLLRSIFQNCDGGNIVPHCLKFIKNVAFEFPNFGIFQQFLSDRN